ncbi:hypothetical protein [Bacillus badius]|nr:hypothetical protein [Bacillus badius]
MPFNRKRKRKEDNKKYSFFDFILDLLLAVPELLLFAVRSLLFGLRYALRWVADIF